MHRVVDRAIAPPAPARRRRALRLFAVAVVVAAPLFTLAFIARFGVNGPDWDHLILSELFNRWHDGTLTAGHLFAQHNEHRPVVPRLVMLALGKATRFDNLAEMYVQWALICCTALLLARAFARDTGTDLLAFVPVVLLLFSIRQYEILLIGEGLLTYLSLTFLVTSLYCLVTRPPTRVSFTLAVTAAVVASFCQSNALLVWPLGLAAILTGLRVPGRGHGAAAAGLWTVAAAAVLWVYFRNYVDPANHPTGQFVLAYPKVGAMYFLAVGGGPLAGELWSTIAMGMAMLALEIVLALALVAEWWRARVRLPLAVWLIACAVATQVMITLNRAGFGLQQALSSRYSTYLALAPIGVYWCVLAYRARWGAAAGRLATIVVTIIAVGWTSASIEGWFSGKAISDVHKWHAYLLYTAKYQPASLLRDLYPNPDHARAYSAGLERLRLNVFADEHIDPAGLTLTSVRPRFAVDSINGQAASAVKTLDVAGDQAVIVDGWALDPDPALPASAVFVTIDGALDIPTMMGGGAGFRGSFSAAVLTPGVHRVSLKIVAADRRHAFLTEPVFDVVKP